MISETMPEITATLLGQILGRQVTALKIRPFTIGARDASVIAIYEESDGTLAGICVCDLGLVANAGAALCLIPARMAKESVDTRQLGSLLIESFKEVLNICSQLFVGPEGHRVKLGSVFVGPGVTPDRASTILSSPAWRLDVQLSIAGYGTGRMSIMQ